MWIEGLRAKGGYHLPSPLKDIVYTLPGVRALYGKEGGLNDMVSISTRPRKSYPRLKELK